jgi:hypothetical protein
MDNVLIGVLGKKPNESIVNMAMMLGVSIRSQGGTADVAATGEDVLWKLASSADFFTHIILFPPTWEGNADCVDLEMLCGCVSYVNSQTQIFVEMENYLHCQVLSWWTKQSIIHGVFHALQTVEFVGSLGLINWKRTVGTPAPARPTFVRAQ